MATTVQIVSFQNFHCSNAKKNKLFFKKASSFSNRYSTLVIHSDQTQAAHQCVLTQRNLPSQNQLSDKSVVLHHGIQTQTQAHTHTPVQLCVSLHCGLGSLSLAHRLRTPTQPLYLHTGHCCTVKAYQSCLKQTVWKGFLSFCTHSMLRVYVSFSALDRD